MNRKNDVITSFFEIYVFSIMILDCLLIRKLQSIEKLLYLLLILFFPILGAIIYFFAVFLRSVMGNAMSRRKMRQRKASPKGARAEDDELSIEGYQQIQGFMDYEQKRYHE